MRRAFRSRLPRPGTLGIVAARDEDDEVVAPIVIVMSVLRLWLIGVAV